jgi:hypothetical protein
MAETPAASSAAPKHDSYLPPYLLINKNALIPQQPTVGKNASGIYKDAHNERA